MITKNENIIKNIKSYFNDLKKYKNKTLSILIKDFLKSTIKTKRKILLLFLLSDDSDDEVKANILHELITKNEDVFLKKSCSHTIYNSYHWNIQKLFKTINKNVNEKKKKLELLNNNNISYENKILSLNCSDYIKSKAMEKFNEIKTKENTSKPKQYLDGLIKIPFNIYHKEEIFYIYENFIKFVDDFIKLLNSKLNYFKNSLSTNIYNIIKNILNNYYEKNISENVIENYIVFLYNSLNKINNNNINNINNINDINHEIININNKNSDNITLNNLNNNNDEDIIDNIDKINESDIHNLKIKNKLSSDITLLSKNQLDNLIKSNSTDEKNKIIDMYNNCIIKLNYFNDIKDIILNNKNLKKKDINLIKEKINEIKKNNKKNNSEIELFYNFINDNVCSIIRKWKKYKNDKLNYINNVDTILNKCVYGHTDVKMNIKRLVGQWINGDMKGHCIGLVGPPGIGKTTICKDGISKCLVDSNGKKRPFAFLALGGSTNGSLLVGHSYTYLGSVWGKIVDILIETQCMNPIIYIDELDKVSNTEHGQEITNILTHLTDPTQNKEFQDKYFSGIPFDLSKVLFIFSYNDKSKIDRILRDRIQEINIKALNKREKLIISQKYVLPEICKTVGFLKNEIVFNKDEILELIDSYTYEAGVRKLNEIYYDIIREVNLMRITNNNIKFPFIITKEFIQKILYNKPKINRKIISKKNMIGLVNGLYATNLGVGGITLIEVMKTPTEKRFSIEKLTGSQGDVMKESMQCALTLVWNILPNEIKNNILENGSGKNRGMGLHIHCPEASTPKDGPSAGCAIVTAIVSQICGIAVRNTIAMTGEIDLNGNVHKIGGLDAKLNGALLAGVKKVLIPYENKEDYNMIIDKEKNIELTSSVNLKTDKTKTFISNNLTVKFVKNIREVLKYALVKNSYTF